MPKRQLTLFCDESSKKGPHYSNFYGGVVVSSNDRESIEKCLSEKKEELNLFKELKWVRITENYAEKYIDFIRFYFSFIESGRLKVRIMFTQNFHKPMNLNEMQLEDRYFILYYQLIKHAFGFRYSNPNSIDKVIVSILLDDLPDTQKKIDLFKEHISKLPMTSTFFGKNIYFPYDQIAGVDSKQHSILQGLDIILGAMQFRLNDFHKQKEEGKRRRGKRTIAKERVYKEINRLVRNLHPNFNIGVSTGRPNGEADTWRQPYRHWLFIPKDHQKDFTATKQKAPQLST